MTTYNEDQELDYTPEEDEDEDYTYDDDDNNSDVVELSAEDFALLTTNKPKFNPFVGEQVIITYAGETHAFNLVKDKALLSYIVEFCSLYNISYEVGKLTAKLSNESYLDLAAPAPSGIVYMSKVADTKG